MSRTRRTSAEATDPSRRSLGRSRRRLVLLGVVALLLQLPFAIFMSTHDGADPIAGAVRIVVAAASPVLFVLCARWPGSRAAIIAGLTLFDILLWAALTGNDPTAGQMNGPSDGPWSGDGPSGMWAQGITGPEMTPFYAAFLFALVAAMVRGHQVWAVASAAGVWLGALLLAPFLGVEWSVGRVASATVGLLIALGIGAFARRRREGSRLAAEEARVRHQEVIAAERLRIARDLHDVLGHSLSQINVQAGVGEHLIDKDPDQARRALAAIKELSRTGLNEVRSVLHTMRSDAAGPLAPVRGLDDVPALMATMTGRPAIHLADRRRLRPDGTRESPGSAVDAAGYRIVQEALTNVVRHAQAASAAVEIFREDSFVSITITDDGLGTDDAAVLGRSEGPGTGVLGMAERAKLLDGTFAITSAPGKGTRVSIRLPWAGDHGHSTGKVTP